MIQTPSRLNGWEQLKLFVTRHSGCCGQLQWRIPARTGWTRIRIRAGKRVPAGELMSVCFFNGWGGVPRAGPSGFPSTVIPAAMLSSELIPLACYTYFEGHKTATHFFGGHKTVSKFLDILNIFGHFWIFWCFFWKFWKLIFWLFFTFKFAST